MYVRTCGHVARMYVCMVMCMYIHTYIRTYLCVYGHVYVRIYVYTYIRTYVCVYGHVYVRIYVYTYICMCVWSCSAPPMYVCVCLCVCVCVYLVRRGLERDSTSWQRKHEFTHGIPALTCVASCYHGHVHGAV
jgi:hypothetical protein